MPTNTVTRPINLTGSFRNVHAPDRGSCNLPDVDRSPRAALHELQTFVTDGYTVTTLSPHEIVVEGMAEDGIFAHTFVFTGEGDQLAELYSYAGSTFHSDYELLVAKGDPDALEKYTEG